MVWYACCAAEEKKNQHAVTEILDNCTWINIHTLPVRTLPISSSPSHSLTIIFTIASSHYHLHHHILGLPLSPSHYHSSSHSIIILTLSPMSSSQSLLAKLFCGIDKTNRVYVFTITIVQCTLMLPFYVGTFTVLSQGTPLLYILITFSVTFSMLYAHTMYIIAITMTVLILLSARHQSGGDAYTGGLWSKMAAAV